MLKTIHNVAINYLFLFSIIILSFISISPFFGGSQEYTRLSYKAGFPTLKKKMFNFGSSAL
jgi:hypothetical protein